MEKKLSTVAQNIRQRMYDLDIRSYKALEDKAGITRDSIRNLMSGRTTALRATKLNPIAKALDISVDELTSAHQASPSKINENTILVPKYDMRMEATSGIFPNGEKVLDQTPFNRNWLKFAIKGQTENLAVVEIEGDSMEPTFRSGDEVLINLNDTSIVDSGIFALIQNETLVIKRIFSIPDGFEFRSENTSHPSWIVKTDNLNAIKIIGRAVVRVGRLN